MELKVGDKVRWIGGENWLGLKDGHRGDVTAVQHDSSCPFRIHWDGKTVVWCQPEKIIKEFQPGDRVVRLAPGTAYLLEGTLGTICRACDEDDEFKVVWDNGFGEDTNGDLYEYRDNLVAYHTAPATSPLPPPVPTIPAIPPPPPVPRIQEKKWGRCYRCGGDDAEMNDNGIRLCEYCKER